MDKGLVSVIVPLYNCEDRILKCVRSILNQSYENIEVIVINDGSTDNSLKVLQEGISDPRLKIYTQENHGVSYTRNRGIEIALSNETNGWITFVDSDDYIDPNTIYDCLDCSNLDEIDFVHYGTCRIDEKEAIINNSCNNEIRVINQLESFEMFLKGKLAFKLVNGNWLVFVTSGIFRKKKIKDGHVLFEESMQLAEDALFVNDYLDLCTRVRIVNKPYHFWWERYGSLSSVTGKKAVSNLIKECTILWPIMFAKIKQFGSSLDALYAAWIISYFNTFLDRGAKVNLSYQDVKEYLNKILDQKEVLDFVYRQKLYSIHECIARLMLKSKSAFISYVVIKVFRIVNGYWKQKR